MSQEAPGAEHTPYQTVYGLLGREGLQLSKALDQLSLQELSRMANLFHTGGDLQSRPGQGTTAYAQTGGAAIHSTRRLNDPANNTYTRFVGAGSVVYRGPSGVLTQVDTGYSGDPLTFATARPPQSGEPWMVVADRTKMRKFSRTSQARRLGLDAPAAPTLTVNAGKSTRIVEFDASDGTNATSWTGTGLGDSVGVGVGANPVLSDIPGDPDSINLTGVNVSTQIGTATTGYGTVIRMALPIDVSKWTTDATDITDEDILHVSIRMDDPSKVEEIRIYFVTSVFSLGTPLPVIPGTFPGVGVSPVNYAAYMHAYRPSDYAAFIAYEANARVAEQAIRTSTLLADYKDDQALAGDSVVTASSPAAHTWVDFGKIGLPVRRGDFIKIGPAGEVGYTWANVTGIYITIQTTTADSVNVAFDDGFFFGGYAPDSSEVGSQKFDYRVTNIDPATGVESNGSTTLADTLWVDALRQSITIQPVPDADTSLVQGFYRRGGSLTDNWRFVGQNAANGAPFVDTVSDAALTTAETLPTDHFRPVATTTAAGATVLDQPVPVIFGPLEDGTYLACGDPYRPGHLYASLPGMVDYWPSTGNYAQEVCAPSEELMNGVATLSGQGLVFSRERGYAVHVNPVDGAGIAVQPTGIIPGMACRWGIAQGPGGVFYVAKDGIRVTGGETSEYLSDQIRPLFQYDPNGTAAPVAVNGYLPIDWTHPEAIQLEVHNLELWFLYQDTGGTRQCLVFSLLYRYWRPYTFAKVPSTLFDDSSTTGLRLIMGGTDGNLYVHEGFSDAGTAIACALRTGAWDLSDTRDEKQLGDLVVDADLQGASLTLQTLVNDEQVTNTAQVVAGAVGQRKYLFDPFGTVPQHARNLSCHLTVTAPLTAGISLRRLGASYLPNAPITMNRPTAWERVTQEGTEGYLYACQIDCDTGGTPRSILVEYDLAGVITIATTLTVLADGRHKLWFSWPVVHAMAVRLRPQGECEPWLLFSTRWIAQPEPPRITGWDTNFEDLGDRYYTGLDLTCDTFGAVKTLEITIDGVLAFTKTVQTTGKRFVHLDLSPPGRAHIFRFRATDANPGLLYDHKWITTPEPGEQANWNAGFTIWSSLSDKYLKGLIIEADTFGEDKSVDVEADGAIVATVTPVNHLGRVVKNYTFPQVLGRVFRVIPSDVHPSRPYTILPLFDEEPYALARWESQLQDFGMPGSGWGSILSGDICYRSTSHSTWTVQCYNSQGVLVQTLTHVLPSTGGAKQKVFIPAAAAHKGVLFKQVFTTDDGRATLTLYREESRVRLAPWGSAGVVLVRSLGDDDLDPTRQMTSAVGAASRPGGGT